MTHDYETALLLGFRVYQGVDCEAGHGGARRIGNRACIECEKAKQKVRDQTPGRRAAERARKLALKVAHYAANPTAKAEESRAYRARVAARPSVQAKRQLAKDRQAFESLARRLDRAFAKTMTKAKREALAPARALELRERKLIRDRVKQKRRRAVMRGARGEAGARVALGLLDLQGGCCAYCGEPAEHLDHKWPISMEGRHVAWNLQWLCGFHNMSKKALPDSLYRLLNDIPARTPWDVESGLIRALIDIVG